MNAKNDLPLERESPLYSYNNGRDVIAPPAAFILLQARGEKRLPSQRYRLPPDFCRISTNCL